MGEHRIGTCSDCGKPDARHDYCSNCGHGDPLHAATEAELDRLRAENAALKRSCDDWEEEMRIYRETDAAEKAKLRADAERYRWLRDHGAHPDDLSIWCYYDGIHMQQGAALDAAIDAARGAK